MDSLSRLIALLVLVVPAQCFAVPVLKWANSDGIQATTAATAAAVTTQADAMRAYYDQSQPTGWTYSANPVACAANGCMIIFSKNNGMVSATWWVTRVDDGTVSCPAAGAALTTGESVWETPALTTSVCHNGCSGSGTTAGARDGKFYVWGPFTSSGATCTGGTGTTTQPTNPAPLPSKPGYCPGTVNGATVQVPCSSSKTTETATSGTSGTSASGVPSSGPTTTSEKSTTCVDGKCSTTTTTTTTNPDGSKTTTTGNETKPEDKDSFCKQNPTLSICKESSISGSCAAVSCSGDAIQCAMAREQSKRNCELIDTETTLSSIGRTAANGGDPADHPKNSQSSIAVNLSTMLDATPLFGSSNQCPADITITHDGRAFVLPFGSTLCPYLRLLGAAFLAACYLAAGFIVFGRS